MKLNIFGKDQNIKKARKSADKAPEKQAEAVEAQAEQATRTAPAGNAGLGIMRGFFVSEKSSRLAQLNQYVFEVDPHANKNEIRKYITKAYSVKVKDVKVINLPKKRRDIGRRPGFRPGVRKAIVILEKGQVIEQARP